MGPQLFLHATAPEPRLVSPVRNDARGWGPDQPTGGLWTSTYLPHLGSRHVQHYSLARPHFGCWMLTPEPSARIATIDCRGDLEYLGSRYGWAQPVGSYALALDFENLARHVDGLHLTEQGARECCLPASAVLASWMYESTLWFRWAFGRTVQYLGLDGIPRRGNGVGNIFDVGSGEQIMARLGQEAARGGG